jgi:hypothetical protein
MPCARASTCPAEAVIDEAERPGSVILESMSEKEPLQALLDEFAGERAHALGRIAARMERALAELRAFDEAGLDGQAGAVTREELVAAAAEWVWYYVVQRDVMGWHRHDEALRFYDVPGEVIVRMGPRLRRPG